MKLRKDKGEDVMEEYDLGTERAYVIKYISSTSEDMENVCLYCGQVNTFLSYLQCYDCHHWVIQSAQNMINQMRNGAPVSSHVIFVLITLAKKCNNFVYW